MSDWVWFYLPVGEFGGFRPCCKNPVPEITYYNGRKICYGEKCTSYHIGVPMDIELDRLKQKNGGKIICLGHAIKSARKAINVNLHEDQAKTDLIYWYKALIQIYNFYHNTETNTE